jgi:ABC-type transport system substrate-binding protein
MKSNPNFYDQDLFFYTGYNFRIIEESDVRFAEFLAGRLEIGGIPSARVEEFRNDPRLRVSPGATTWRLGLNAAGTREAQQAQRSILKARGGTIDPNAQPKPIMASADFRKALYFAIDREFVAYEVIKTQDPAPHFFSSAYLVEPEEGIAFRGTPQGQAVNAEYSPETLGYNPDAARALFDQALAPLVANGTYSSGEVITLLLAYQAGSDAWAALVDYLKPQFESLFNSSTYNIRVEIELTAVPFPNNYFDYIIPGVSDMGIGGISGGTLNLAGFLNNYRYDNEGTFVLTWGIDTREANIPITYSFAGETRQEVWSMDAIHKALVGEVYLYEGTEGLFPAPTQLVNGFENVSFTISNFVSPAFTNIRYTLEQDVDGTFVPVQGFDNVVPSSRIVSLRGLTAGTSYRVVVSFTLGSGEIRTTNVAFTTLAG